MRRLFVLFLFLLLGTFIGLLIDQDPGYFLVSYHQWVVETPLWLFIIGLILSYFLISFVFVFIKGLFDLPGGLRRMNKKWKRLRIARLNQRAFLALFEGRWRYAEKCLLNAVKYTRSPFFYYLGVAKAAQAQGDSAKRDIYLKKAHDSQKGSDMAVGLTQGELQIQAQQYEQALATLHHLQELEPKHRYVLQLLKKLYLDLKEWHLLLLLLPKLRKKEVIDEAKEKELTIICYKHLIEEAKSPEQLAECYKRVPHAVKNDNNLIEIYARALHRFRLTDRLEKFICDTLKKQQHPALLSFFAAATVGDAPKRLKVAEGWLKQFGESAPLLLALGRLAMQNELWGQAKHYLETSLKLSPTPEAYQALADIYLHLNETANSLTAYKKGLALALTSTGIRGPS